MDSVITAVVKFLSVSQSGTQGRHSIALETAAVSREEDSPSFSGRAAMIQQRKKVPERQTLHEDTGKHSVFCRVFEAGIWRVR